MGVTYRYDILPVSTDIFSALARWRELLSRGSVGRKSWIEFSTTSANEVLEAYDLVGLPEDDPVGVEWKSTGRGDKSAEAASLARALVGMAFQDENRRARTMHIYGRLRGAPRPATRTDQGVDFLHNQYWSASAGVFWVHRGPIPRPLARWSLFRSVFLELGLERHWNVAKEYFQEGTRAAARRGTAREEPIIDGIRVKGMGWDTFGAMSFVLTPPRSETAVAMFETLRSKLLAKVYSYSISIGGSPAEIRRFAKENIRTGQSASFFGHVGGGFQDSEIHELDAFGREFVISQPLDLEFQDDTYSFDLALAKRDATYHVELHYHRSGGGTEISPLIEKLQTDWGVRMKLTETT